METITSLLRPAVDYWLLNDRFSDVQGFLDPIEGYALHLLAAFGPGEGCVTEIGSLYGRSTCYLAAGCMLNGRGTVHAVDTFEGSPEHQPGQRAEQADIKATGTTFKTFIRNLATHGLETRVRPVKARSLDAAAAWSGDIRLLFIDGDHSYEATRDDFRAWSPFVCPGGVVAFHDVSTWEGVTRFYEELLGQGGWVETLSVGTLRVVRRAEPA